MALTLEELTPEEQHASWHHFDPIDCWSLTCRATVWRGPDGLTANDLVYSVIYSAPAQLWLGMTPRNYPRPDEGEKDHPIAWTFSRMEKDNDEPDDDWFTWVYSATMDLLQLLEVLGHWDGDNGQSGGIMHPSGAEGWWSPAVSLLTEDDSAYVTAWPKRRNDDTNSEHLFDEWEVEGDERQGIVGLLSAYNRRSDLEEAERKAKRGLRP